MTASLGEASVVPASFFLTYFISLPRYDESLSNFRWTLKLYKSNEAMPTASLSGDGKLPYQITLSDPTPKKIFANTESSGATTYDPNSGELSIQGKDRLAENNNIESIELNIVYWPDQSDNSSTAKIVHREDKLRYF